MGVSLSHVSYGILNIKMLTGRVPPGGMDGNYETDVIINLKNSKGSDKKPLGIRNEFNELAVGKSTLTSLSRYNSNRETRIYNVRK